MLNLEAKLDVDVVALQAEDEITCLLTFEAPMPSATGERPAETLIVVVDRSGSMRGPRLASVRTSLHTLVDRLKPQDTIGVVTFDDEAAVHIPARPMGSHDSHAVHGLIESMRPGGSTNLGGGYLMGLSEARRALGPTGASIIVLSDGHANQGIMDPVKLGSIAHQGREDGLTTTTIGIGAGYDETLLSEIAARGSGSHRFAYTDDDAIAVVGEEAGDLLSKAIINAVARIKPRIDGVIDNIAGFQGLPHWINAPKGDSPELVITLGDLYAGEKRELLLRVAVPALGALGHAHLADIEITYVALPEIVEQTITWPLAVNVVPGDEAATRVPDPRVVSARLVAEVSQAKQEASEQLRLGHGQAAAALMTERANQLRAKVTELGDALPAESRQRLLEEAEQAEKLARGAQEREAHLMRKSMLEDLNLDRRGRSDAGARERNRNKRDF